MLDGPIGRFVFLASLMIAFLTIVLEVVIAFHPTVISPTDVHLVLIAALAFAAGAAGIKLDNLGGPK